MDQLLLPYLNTTEESERQRHLDELLLLYAAPVIRNTLRLKLGFYVDQSGASAYNPDAEDLYQEIMAKIVQALNDLRRESKVSEIERFRDYVFRVASNACVTFLRAKSPARRRLKDNVRVVLIRHPDLAIWKTERAYLCGFTVWQQIRKPVSPNRESLLDESKLALFRSTRFSKTDLTQIPLPRVIAELFDWIEGPVELNTLVNSLARLLKVKDRFDEPIDNESEILLPDPQAGRPSLPISTRAEEMQLLRQLWEVLKQLPKEQRDAYTFRFHDDDGNDLFSLLIESEIVDLAQLGETFARSVQEIRRLRSRMPMDGASAAAELGVSSSQVHKWRFLAAKRLKKELMPVLGKRK
jgi:RNA polymerase sigma factor (sigma-70 family)